MGVKRKLFKYAQLATFNNAFQYANMYIEDDFHLKGSWHKDYFGNNNPIVLELGCGKGEYSNAMAAMFPDKNFIGVDYKGDRLYKACLNSIENKLKNVVYIRTQIDFIEKFFAVDEVSEIWITFPDPQLQKPRLRKRLTSSENLSRYRSFLKPGSPIHLKTDNLPLFNDTIDFLNESGHEIHALNRDVHALGNSDPLLAVKTHYEKLFSSKGAKINYVCFSLKQPIDGL